MDSLKSKLPTIEFKNSDYLKKVKQEKTKKLSKEKYLDDLLNKDFIKKYFEKEKN